MEGDACKSRIDQSKLQRREKQEVLGEKGRGREKKVWSVMWSTNIEIAMIYVQPKKAKGRAVSAITAAHIHGGAVAGECLEWHLRQLMKNGRK